jgi:hypothetical protein
MLCGKKKSTFVSPPYCLHFHSSLHMTPPLSRSQHGLLYGSADVRAQSAHGVGELIDLTPVDALKPVLVSKLAGPLIRIVGDRFPPAVKTAILNTLAKLIGKCGKHLKQFLPPLQTAFVKTLYDPSAAVRRAGAKALALLMQLQPKIEPLITEILASIRQKPEADLRASLFDALRGVLHEASSAAAAGVVTLSAAAQQALRECVVDFATAPENAVRAAAARCMGAIARVQSGDGGSSSASAAASASAAGAGSSSSSSGFAALLVDFALRAPDASVAQSTASRLKQSKAESLASILAADPQRCAAYVAQIAGSCGAAMVDDNAACRVAGAVAAYQVRVCVCVCVWPASVCVVAGSRGSHCSQIGA